MENRFGFEGETQLMIATQEKAVEEPEVKTVTYAGVVLICLSFSILSFLFLPRTVFSMLSLLAPLNNFLRIDNISTTTATITSVLALVSVLLFLVSLEKKSVQTILPILSLTGVYFALFAFTSLQTSFDKFENYKNGCAVVLQPIVIGLLGARLCGTAARTLYVVALLGVIQAVIAIYYLRTGVNVL